MPIFIGGGRSLVASFGIVDEVLPDRLRVVDRE